jgi:N,N'-diacetyllegionaminate synthase
MSTYKEIDSAVDYLKKNGLSKKNLTLLHCTSAYPAPLKEVNLNVLNAFKDRYKLPIGYSDHTLGSEVAIAAVALGASIIEKHFTLDKRLRGPDHKMSLDPLELYNFVQSIRNTEIALGDAKKIVTKSEKINQKIVRKSIVAATSIKKGELFSEFNITTKRPFYGMSPIYWDTLVGKKSKKNYEKDDYILDEK